jgi:hypothetical protein
VARGGVAVAENLVQLLLDRDRALVVQDHRLGGLSGVVVERRLGVSEDEHLSNPEAELSGAATVLRAILQDGKDLIKENLRNERLGLFALRQRREIFFLNALVLFVRGEPRNVTRAVGRTAAVLSGSFELRSLNVEWIIRRVGSSRNSSIARVEVQSTKNTFQTSSGVRLSIVSGRRREAADRSIAGSV